MSDMKGEAITKQSAIFNLAMSRLLRSDLEPQQRGYKQGILVVKFLHLAKHRRLSNIRKNREEGR